MASDPRFTNRRVLIIDDQPAIHEDFRKILAANKPTSLLAMGAAILGSSSAVQLTPPFELDSAYSGKEGLDRIRLARAAQRPYALALVDGRMPPGWDGIETLEHIFEEDPDIQAALCTAYADYDWSGISRRLPQTERFLILKKPFEPIEIRQLAAALTGRWSQDAALRAANRQLTLYYTITRILTNSSSIAEGGAELLTVIGETFGWSFGALWSVTEEGDRLWCASTFATLPLVLETMGAATLSSTAGDRGLPARARTQRQFCVVQEPTPDDDERAGMATELGMRAAFFFPVVIDDRVEIVLEFWGPVSTTITPEMEALMVEVCAKISACVERDRLRAHLQRSEMLAALSTPLIPLGDHVVVMPLIGELDGQRSSQIRSTLLQGIAARSVHTVILDVTGVPRLSEDTAEQLVRTAHAVRLLGARLVLTGLGREAASCMVAIGADLSGILTLRTLKEGIAFAMRSATASRQ